MQCLFSCRPFAIKHLLLNGVIAGRFLFILSIGSGVTPTLLDLCCVLLFCLVYLCRIKLFEAHVSFSFQGLVHKGDQSVQPVPLLHQKCFLLLQSSLFFISWILHDRPDVLQ